jgi:long-chain acyl-CoA synthetase
VSGTPASKLEPAPGDAPGRRTIASIWHEAIAEKRARPAYLVERDGAWHPMTWAEAAERVTDLANGLLALGVCKGDAFGILATTRIEWILFDYALALTGGVTVPIYPTSSADDVAYALSHVDAIGVFVEDAEQRAKIDETRTGLPTLEHVLAIDDLDDLAARGRDFAAANPDALDRAAATIDDDDLFTFMYTSGTTGPPKACMIRHRNAHAMVSIVDEVDELTDPTGVALLWLPLAHNFGRLLHLRAAHVGFTLALCGDPARLVDALPATQPTLLPSVPRIFEKVYDAAQASFATQTGAKKKLADWALGVGYRTSKLKQRGEPLPPGLALQHRIAGLLVYSKFRARFGGHLRMAVSGAAPLAIEVAEFFHALDVLILEGYGLTECTSAATVNRPSKFRFGTVGLPLPGYETRIAEDGELLLRSPTIFAGYYHDEEATRAVLDDDGWLHTGDVAEIDEDGFVRITDRKKDILVTAGGKNVAPQNLENALKTSRFVSQALVVGDRRPYIAALIALDDESIRTWAAEHSLRPSPDGLSHDPQVVALVQSIVDDANRGRSPFEQIKRFTILPRDFSAEEGEVTPTLKLRRRIAQEHFALEIDQLYAG